MLEAFGDLWTFGPVDARVITTNGDIAKDGHAIMGRGVAKQAVSRFPGVEFRLGAYLREWGNRPFNLGAYALGGVEFSLVSMPVKHHWREPADIHLIEGSAELLVELVDRGRWQRVVLPRAGCGNGGLNWEMAVRPVLADILDDRFISLGR